MQKGDRKDRTDLTKLPLVTIDGETARDFDDAVYCERVGQDFRLLLKADDYFDFIILLMLGMGLVFQMPAITYVLARIGLVTAGWMVRVWRVAVIIILIVAAVLSPTNDVPNMLLFAAPMFALYAISIVVAWICGRKRQTA